LTLRFPESADEVMAFCSSNASISLLVSECEQSRMALHEASSWAGTA
jgi:hypothetical protein